LPVTDPCRQSDDIQNDRYPALAGYVCRWSQIQVVRLSFLLIGIRFEIVPGGQS
jgi:hypothetical protein